MTHNVEINKLNAISFYRMAFEGKPRKAVEMYVGDEYIQHNPSVRDGKVGFVDYFEQMCRGYKSKRIEFLRAVSEGDLVALHTRQIWPDNEEYVTMDFFDLMITVKLLSIGTRYKAFRRNR